MNCPYLVKDVIYVCGSAKDEAIPGARKLKESCKCGRHIMCPEYVARTSMRYALPELMAS